MSQTREAAGTGGVHQPSIKERREAIIRKMGFAEKHRLNLAPPNTTFWAILSIVVVLTALGLTMVLSSSSIANLNAGESPYRLFVRQSLWALVGLAAAFFVYLRPYQSWRNEKLLFVMVVGSAGLNLVTPFIGRNINGATAWIQIGSFRIQPSEFMKITVILFCAHFLSLRHRYVAVWQKVLLPVLTVLGGAGFLLVLQKDYGTALVFALIVLTMLFMAGVPMGQMTGTTAVLAAAGMGVLTLADNASKRLFAFLNLDDELVRKKDGYQVWQSILSIANGGVKGTGIGSGTSKWGYVPLAYSDFIFAVIAEELGLLGSFLVIFGFVLLVFFGVRVALGARDMHGAFLAGGITAWFGFQMFINIGGILGVIPMTGITLPFMSYGGSSLVATMIASAVLLNVARNMK